MKSRRGEFSLLVQILFWLFVIACISFIIYKFIVGGGSGLPTDVPLS